MADASAEALTSTPPGSEAPALAETRDKEEAAPTSVVCVSAVDTAETTPIFSAEAATASGGSEEASAAEAVGAGASGDVARAGYVGSLNKVPKAAPESSVAPAPVVQSSAHSGDRLASPKREMGMEEMSDVSSETSEDAVGAFIKYRGARDEDDSDDGGDGFFRPASGYCYDNDLPHREYGYYAGGEWHDWNECYGDSY